MKHNVINSEGTFGFVFFSEQQGLFISRLKVSHFGSLAKQIFFLTVISLIYPYSARTFSL